MWSNTMRGAQFLDGTMPRLVRAIEKLADVLEARGKEAEEKETEDEITLRVLHAALDACGGRSVHLAEVIDDLERKMSPDVKGRIYPLLDLSTSHVKGPDPDWGDLRALAHAHGWIVYVSPDAEDSVPKWFRPIHQAAAENKCMLVNFDSAADTVDCFETWEW